MIVDVVIDGDGDVNDLTEKAVAVAVKVNDNVATTSTITFRRAFPDGK